MPSHILPSHIQDLKVDQSSKKWIWILLATIILLILIGASVLIFCLTKNDAKDDSGSSGKPTASPDVGTTTPFVISKDPMSTVNIPTIKTCTTSSCQDDAARLINAIDSSVDPCQDFFQYACGGWIANKPEGSVADIKRHQASSSVLNILKAKVDPNDPIPVNQARDFYAACMNTTLLESIGLRPLLNLLGKYGDWPMTIESWTSENFSWQEITTDIKVVYGANVFVTVSNEFSLKNSLQNVIHIDQASLILPRSDILEKTRIAEYTAFINGAAKEIRDDLQSTATDSQIENDIADMLRFESALATITTPSEDPKRSKFSWMHKPMTLYDLQAWTDRVTTSTDHAKINWFDFINRIYLQGAGIDVPKNEKMLVSETDYLQNLITLLDKTPFRTIANYVNWNLVYRLAGRTNQRMKDLSFQFNGMPMTLDESCADEANKVFGFAISHNYVASNFDGKNEIQEMVTNLKAASKSLVSDASWMASSDKAIVKEKVDHMVSNVGYPDWIMNRESLESYYSSLSTSRENYFESYQNASLFLNTETFKMLRGVKDRGIWNDFPDTHTAHYDPYNNAFTITASYLQSPFFKRGRMAAMNYGAAGVTIGHEITHAFNDRGRHFDKYGSLYGSKPWSSKTSTNHRSRVQCLINQYNNYTSPKGTNLNGRKTQEEDVADNVGLRQAFRAYKLYVATNGVEPKLPGLEEFTSEQIFFLSYANKFCSNHAPEFFEFQIQKDTHSSQKFRVIGSLSNNDDFVSQFNCPTGSPMNRFNKCTVW